METLIVLYFLFIATEINIFFVFFSGQLKMHPVQIFMQSIFTYLVAINLSKN